MSKRSPHPSYRQAGKVYRADSCQPLVRAAAAGEVRLEAMARGGYPGVQLPKKNMPGLSSVGFWDAEREQSWGLPLHRNEGLELSFLASGSMPVMVDGHRQTMAHDEFLVTRPWQPHQLGDPDIGPGKLVWIIIDVGVRRPHQPWAWPSWVVLTPDDLAELTRFLRQNEQYVWPGSADVRRCFLGIAQAVESRRLSMVAVMINELLLVLLEMFRARRIPLRVSLTSTARTVRQFLNELDASLDRPWTVEAMAESCHLGVTRFVQYCEKLTNMAPARYLRHKRVQKAAALLAADPARPVTDIAFACGFSSSQHFASVFRQLTGKTPRASRKRA